MKNVQISLDENLLDAVDRLASARKKTRSAIVREALRDWLRQREIMAFERKWISRLKESQEDVEEAEAWMEVQTWSEP